MYIVQKRRFIWKQLQSVVKYKITDSNFVFPKITYSAQKQQQFENQVYVFSKQEAEESIKNLNIKNKQFESLKKSKVEWFYTEKQQYLLAYEHLKTLQQQKNDCSKISANTQEDQAKLKKEKEQQQKLSETIVALGSKSARALHQKKISECDIRLPENFQPQHTGNFLKGFLLSNYKFEGFDKPQQQQQIQKPDKSSPSPSSTINNSNEPDQEEIQEKEEAKTAKHFKPITSINMVNQQIDSEEVQFRIKSAFYTLYARQLSNLRADVANTLFFKNEVHRLFKDRSEVQVECLVGDEVFTQGLKLAHAVGRASCSPPVVINMTYLGESLLQQQKQPEKNNNNQSKLHCFIGKGLCFDSGGLNIKPTGYMETMYMDKAGACAVLAAFRAAVEMQMPVNLTCSIGVVENFLGSKAYRPSDIIKSHKGLTVEIGNTDAEGRLVLADVMSWTQQKYAGRIEDMIELSTLTGACMVALGEGMAGVFSNNENMAENVLQSGREEGEQLWRLPIVSEHRESIKSDFADLKNSGKSRYGGASQAAAFLESFVEKDVKWVHLDIAGPAESKGVKGVYSAGTTGFGVQTLLNYLRRASLEKKNDK